MTSSGAKSGSPKTGDNWAEIMKALNERSDKIMSEKKSNSEKGQSHRSSPNFRGGAQRDSSARGGAQRDSSARGGAQRDFLGGAQRDSNARGGSQRDVNESARGAPNRASTNSLLAALGVAQPEPRPGHGETKQRFDKGKGDDNTRSSDTRKPSQARGSARQTPIEATDSGAARKSGHDEDMDMLYSVYADYPEDEEDYDLDSYEDEQLPDYDLDDIPEQEPEIEDPEALINSNTDLSQEIQANKYARRLELNMLKKRRKQEIAARGKEKGWDPTRKPKASPTGLADFADDDLHGQFDSHLDILDDIDPLAIASKAHDEGVDRGDFDDEEDMYDENGDPIVKMQPIADETMLRNMVDKPLEIAKQRSFVRVSECVEIATMIADWMPVARRYRTKVHKRKQDLYDRFKTKRIEKYGKINAEKKVKKKEEKRAFLQMVADSKDWFYYKDLNYWIHRDDLCHPFVQTALPLLLKNPSWTNVQKRKGLESMLRYIKNASNQDQVKAAYWAEMYKGLAKERSEIQSRTPDTGRDPEIVIPVGFTELIHRAQADMTPEEIMGKYDSPVNKPYGKPVQF